MDTRTQLLDVAHRLVETRGFNAFSFKDLAASVGIKTASVHYHFPSKADLGEALVERYIEGLEERLAELDEGASTQARLEGFIAVYEGTRQRDALCLCGSLASDLDAVPANLAGPVGRYMTRSEGWLKATLTRGRSRGELPEGADPARLATLFLTSLQGALVIARTREGGAAR
ncbi:MAG: TetR/AcrR family transcriptional regulator, partial [Myxococcota bacterium]